MRPTTVVKRDGQLVPFDVILLRCEGQFLGMMHAADARLASQGTR